MLKELRENHGIVKGDIASKAGVSQAFLYAVESGRRPVSNKLKQILIDHFNVDNIEDYEIEVETDDVKGYSFMNNGQYNDGQSGGTSNYYETNGQSQESQTSGPEQSSPDSFDVLTKVVSDYLTRNNELQGA